MILEDFSNLNDSVIRSRQWGMAQHILLTVVGDGQEMRQSPARGLTHVEMEAGAGWGC